MSSGYALSVKYIFLSFAQQLFANDPVLSWNLDPKSTNIFIGDEYFISNPVIETRPTIILKRSSFKWGQHAIDQMMTRSLTDGNKDFSDVFYGNITYNILSTSAQTAERIADYLFSMLTANRDQFRPKGIMKFIGISMGEQVTLSGPTDIELVNVPINIGYAYNKTLNLVENLSEIQVYSEGPGHESSESSPSYNAGILLQGVDYTVSGQDIVLNNPPVDVKITASYIGNVTLAEYSDEFDFIGTSGSEILTLQEEPRLIFYPLNAIEETYV